MALPSLFRSKLALKVVGALTLLSTALILSACGSSSSDSTSASTESSGSDTSSSTVSGGVPDSSLISPGKLTICTDVPVPPFEMYNESGELEGFEIELGDAFGEGMELEPVWVNTVFDTIIAALKSGKCDAIINDMFITPEREAEIKQIPYLTSGQSFMVTKGNPEGIDPTDNSTLCGKTLTTQLGGAMVPEAKEISAECEANGEGAISLLQPTKFSDSLQQLQTGHAQALFFDSPTNAYYAQLNPDEFEITGPILKDETLLGIGVVKDNKPLIDEFVKQLEALQADGTYEELLSNWNLQDARVPPPQ